MKSAEITRVAERALLVRFFDDELEVAVAKAQAIYFEAKSEKLSLKGKGESRETLSRLVLGAGSCLVELSKDSGRDGLDALFAWLEERVRAIEVAGEWKRAGAEAEIDATREHRIEVRFGGELGPDLEAVAKETTLSPDGVVARLCAAELRVAFVGFSPGFPYLIGLPPELELPRLASPRPRVPAGSVAIAGPFAGIYPGATPGGWRLLGHTERSLFDPAADPPALLAPGDAVRLIPA